MLSIWVPSVPATYSSRALRKTTLRDNLLQIIIRNEIVNIKKASFSIYIPHLIVINFSVSSDNDSLLDAGLRDPSFDCLQQGFDTS